MCRLKSVLALTAVTFFVASAALAEDYEIRLHRPRKAGDRYRMTVTATQKEEKMLKTGGVVTSKTSSVVRVDAVADVTVTAVDEKGEETGKLYKICSLLKTTDGEDTSPLKEGDEITAIIKEGKTFYTMNDEPLSSQSIKTMKMVDPFRATTSDDDEVFGTRERRKVGDTWSPDVEKMAAELGIPKECFAASVMLAGQSTEAGHKCLDVRVDVETTDLPIPPPAGMKVTSATSTITMKVKLPLDPALPTAKEEDTADLEFVTSGTPSPGSPETTIEVRRHEANTNTVEMLK